MKKKKEKINWLIDVGGYSKTEKKEMTTKPKEGKIKEKFEKKLRKLLDEAHLLGKQSWEGDKVDNL